MKNKRAFDRVKHHPGPIEGEGPFPSDGNEVSIHYPEGLGAHAVYNSLWQ